MLFYNNFHPTPYVHGILTAEDKTRQPLSRFIPDGLILKNLFQLWRPKSTMKKGGICPASRKVDVTFSPKQILSTAGTRNVKGSSSLPDARTPLQHTCQVLICS